MSHEDIKTIVMYRTDPGFIWKRLKHLPTLGMFII